MKPKSFDTHFDIDLVERPYDVDTVEISVLLFGMWLKNSVCADFSEILKLAVEMAAKRYEFQIISGTTGQIYASQYERA